MLRAVPPQGARPRPLPPRPGGERLHAPPSCQPPHPGGGHRDCAPRREYTLCCVKGHGGGLCSPIQEVDVCVSLHCLCRPVQEVDNKAARQGGTARHATPRVTAAPPAVQSRGWTASLPSLVSASSKRSLVQETSTCASALRQACSEAHHKGCRQDRCWTPVLAHRPSARPSLPPPRSGAWYVAALGRWPAALLETGR